MNGIKKYQEIALSQIQRHSLWKNFSLWEFTSPKSIGNQPDEISEKNIK